MPLCVTVSSCARIEWKGMHQLEAPQLGLLRKVARINSDLRVLADELGRGLYGELDYRQEASNAQEFAALHAHLPEVLVPAVRLDLTTRRVLTMEWVNGERPSDLLALLQSRQVVTTHTERLLAERKLLNLVRVGVESSLVQLLDTGVMHADPHPGNFLITPSGHVAYLDFGLLCRLEARHSAAMLAAIAHLVNAEWALLTQDLDAMDVLKPSTDRRAITQALEQALGAGPTAVVKDGIPNINFGQVTSELWKIALRFRFKLPPYYTLVLRSLASLEGIGLAVDPGFKVFAYAYPYVLRRLLTNNSPSSRAVLRQLVLTEDGGLRWGRLAAFASRSKQAAVLGSERPEGDGARDYNEDGGRGSWSLSRPGGSTGSALRLSVQEQALASLAPSEAAAASVMASPSLSSALVEMMLSQEAAPARRLLLESNLSSLAESFTSPEAASLRWRLATALADALPSLLMTASPPAWLQIPKRPKMLSSRIHMLSSAYLAAPPALPGADSSATASSSSSSALVEGAPADPQNVHVHDAHPIRGDSELLAQPDASSVGSAPASNAGDESLPSPAAAAAAADLQGLAAEAAGGENGALGEDALAPAWVGPLATAGTPRAGLTSPDDVVGGNVGREVESSRGGGGGGAAAELPSVREAANVVGLLPLPPRGSERVRKKRLWFMLRALLARLRCGPLLSLKLALAAVSVVLGAIALAVGRAVAVFVARVAGRERGRATEPAPVDVERAPNAERGPTVGFEPEPYGPPLGPPQPA